MDLLISILPLCTLDGISGYAKYLQKSLLKKQKKKAEMKPVRVESRNPIRSQLICSPSRSTATPTTGIIPARGLWTLCPTVHGFTALVDKLHNDS